MRISAASAVGVDGGPGACQPGDSRHGVEGDVDMKVDAEGAGLDESRLGWIADHLHRRYIEPGKIAGAEVAVVRGGVLGYFARNGVEGDVDMKVDAEGAGLDESRLGWIADHLHRRYIEPGKIAGVEVAVVRGGVLGYFASFGLTIRN